MKSVIVFIVDLEDRKPMRGKCRVWSVAEKRKRKWGEWV